MAQARTALDHLLDARTALVDEAQRLAATIADLDSLIGSMGGQDRLDDAEEPPAVPGQTVKAAATVTAARTATRTTARKTVSRRGPAKKAPGRSAGTGGAPKSIRVHVLDMLGAENRDFGLAEIIDRVHDAGIQAHDDAVRSITIKLMKDGRVERVGRGQYRLARRGGASRTAEDVEPAGTDAGQEPTPETPAAETLDYSPPLNLQEPWGGNGQS